MIGRIVTSARPPTRPARNVFAPIITGVALIGLISLVWDGPGSCTLMVLKPEVAPLALSACALCSSADGLRVWAPKRPPEMPSPRPGGHESNGKSSRPCTGRVGRHGATYTLERRSLSLSLVNGPA
jgi:hypothetical protein